VSKREGRAVHVVGEHGPVVGHVLDGMRVVLHPLSAPSPSEKKTTHLASGFAFTKSTIVCMETPPHLAIPDHP
jgi:hypothetical protein